MNCFKSHCNHIFSHPWPILFIIDSDISSNIYHIYIILKELSLQAIKYFWNTSKHFTKVKGMIQTSILNHFIMLYCIWLTTIIANWQCISEIITSPMYPFSVTYETVVTKSFRIQGPSSYFVDIIFFVCTKTFSCAIVGLVKV